MFSGLVADIRQQVEGTLWFPRLIATGLAVPRSRTAGRSFPIVAHPSLSLTDNLEMKFGLDAMYSDDYIVANDQDENLNQDAFWKLNARVQLANVGDTWSLALIGKNLTDEETTTWGNDVPLAGQGFGGTYQQFIDAPRSYVLQAKYRF